MCEYQFQVEVQVMHLCSTPINGVKSTVKLMIRVGRTHLAPCINWLVNIDIETCRNKSFTVAKNNNQLFHTYKNDAVQSLV